MEQTPAAQDGYPRHMIDGPENLVRIPRLKHREINGWYQTKNEDFDGMSPRDFLRGKAWEQRTKVGPTPFETVGRAKALLQPCNERETR